MISFPRRWHGGMISVNQEAIWGMSVDIEFPAYVDGTVGAEDVEGE